MLFTADLRTFRDYERTEVVRVEFTTPVKRKLDEGLLTPPDTIRTESVREETKVDYEEALGQVNTHFVRRSKRRRLDVDGDDSFA